jgi:hypothetical protein
MRLSWAQVVAGFLTCAVVAGLLLLPGRILRADQPVSVAVPPAQVAHSVEAAPPLAIRHLHPARPKAQAAAPVSFAAPLRPTFVPRPHTVVRVSPARKLLATHRAAVISKLAPTAPLVRARVLAAATPVRHLAQPKTSPVKTSSAKTIAALAAGLSKK